MSNTLSLASARKIYSEMAVLQRGGCDASCVSSTLYFTTKNCGTDRRFSTGVLACFLRREYGYTEDMLKEVDDIADIADIDIFPALTRTHPIRIIWKLGDLTEDDQLVENEWFVPCPWRMANSRSTSILSVVSMSDEMR